MSTVPAPRPFKQRTRIHVVRAGAVSIAILGFLSAPVWDETSCTLRIMEMAGLALTLMCIFGRLWSILYIGGKKNVELITSGPYSMTRNPLYFSSTVGAVGIGLMFGSIIAALVLGIGTLLVFAVTAAKETAFLKARFGLAYEEYARRTPFFWPNPARYRDGSKRSFSPQALRRSFVESLYFLALFPILELLEFLQWRGVLPVLLRLY